MTTQGMVWRQLEQNFDRLLKQEEEMEAEGIAPVLSRPQGPSASTGKGNDQVRWLQKALNRVTRSAIAENGVPSIQTRKALQKFQADQGLRPTGRLGPKTRAVLIRLSRIPAPRPRHVDDGLEGEREARSGRCPTDSPYVLRGFGQYSGDIQLLPSQEMAKLGPVASEIAGSQSAAPGVARVTEVVVVGHADLDAARERKEPGFLQSVSEKRAMAVHEALFCQVNLEKNHGMPPDIRWAAVGRGARSLAIPNPRNEAERKCNRRVEIILGRKPQPSPVLENGQSGMVAADQKAFASVYHAALQGTSGQYDRPELAAKKAVEIADKAVGFIEQRKRSKEEIAPRCSATGDFLEYFKDAIQGTASKFSDTNLVISKAAETADAAALGTLQETRKLEWKYASPGQPMGPDCEIVRGKVPGPANHALCGTHGHILDTTAHTVIRHDLDEYKKQPPR